MDINNITNIWLEFQGGTLFGEKNHKGVVIATDGEEKIGIAVAVTSNWVGRDNARISAKDPEESIVWIRAKAEKASGIVPRDSVIDCGSIKEFTFDKMSLWLESGKVASIGYNENVKQELLNEIKKGVASSNRVSDFHKNMLKNDTKLSV